MSTYLLTTHDDSYAGDGTDVFQGPASGTDILRDNGGSDMFQIASGQSGLLYGNAGHGRIVLEGSVNNAFAETPRIVHVEELTLDARNLYAWLRLGRALRRRAWGSRMPARASANEKELAKPMPISHDLPRRVKRKI